MSIHTQTLDTPAANPLHLLGRVASGLLFLFVFLVGVRALGERLQAARRRRARELLPGDGEPVRRTDGGHSGDDAGAELVGDDRDGRRTCRRTRESATRGERDPHDHGQQYRDDGDELCGGAGSHGAQGRVPPGVRGGDLP